MIVEALKRETCSVKRSRGSMAKRVSRFALHVSRNHFPFVAAGIGNPIRYGGRLGFSRGGTGGRMCAMLTNSRQTWRSVGDICDQRSAFFKNSRWSSALKAANFENDRMQRT